MILIEAHIKTVDEFKDKWLASSNTRELFLHAGLFDAIEHVGIGDEISASIYVDEKHTHVEITGKIIWKRIKDIKMPLKVISAGVGVALSAPSIETVDKLLSETSESLANVDETMIGGNYIKIRNDIAEKYQTKRRKLEPGEEKRGQPRISVNIGVEVFSDNKVTNFKTLDISLMGMCFETNQKIPLQEEILIIFEDKVLRKHFMVKGKVVRYVFAKDNPEKMLGVGVAFVFENDTQKRDLMNFIIRSS